MRLVEERLKEARDLGRVVAYRDTVIETVERLLEQALTRRERQA
jgi:hypothetical protein